MSICMTVNDEKLYKSKMETLEHIQMTNKYVNKIVHELLHRGIWHDYTKLQNPEVEGFATAFEYMKGVEYGSKEYEECKDKISDIIKHHYEYNRHHPEHFENGVDDMNIIDLIEMLCDWKAAGMKNKNGSLEKSIHICCEKYNISDQLKRIFLNSIPVFQNPFFGDE